MLISKQRATELRAQAHPNCIECVSRLGGPEVYTVTRYRDNALLAWDIDLAVELCQDGRPAFEISLATLEDILKVNATTPSHLDHVSLEFPGIACVVDHAPDDQPMLGLIDGSHRAARCLRDRLPFFSYFLSDEESSRCQNTEAARLCAYLEQLIRSQGVQLGRG